MGSSQAHFPCFFLFKEIEKPMEHEMQSAFIEDYRAYYTQGMENQTRENSEMKWKLKVISKGFTGMAKGLGIGEYWRINFNM